MAAQSGALQVSRTLAASSTRERETAGVAEAMPAYKLKTGWILTEDEEEEIVSGKSRILVCPLWRRLLRNQI